MVVVVVGFGLFFVVFMYWILNLLITVIEFFIYSYLS